MRLRIFLIALISLTSCVTPPKIYSYSGLKNLTAKVTVQDSGFLYDDWGELYIYEELPNCQRRYFGLVKLSGKESEHALPIGKVLTVYLSRISASGFWKEAEENSSWVHFQVKPGEMYRFTFREEGRSHQVLFQSRSGSQGPFHDLQQLPDKNCEKYKYVRN